MIFGVRTASQQRIIRTDESVCVHLINNPTWNMVCDADLVAFTDLLLNTPVKAQTDLNF